MSIFDVFLNNIADRLVSRMMDAENKPIATARAYYAGNHPDQLFVRKGQFNDNIALNFSRLISQRIVSQMLGKGITFDFDGEDESEQEKWLDECLDANKQEVLFHRSALSAGVAGTGYLYLMPGGVLGKDDTEYPRIQLVDPLFTTITTAPDDFETIISYKVEYRSQDVAGKELDRRRIIKQDDIGTWVTQDWISHDASRWEMVSEVQFVDVNGQPLSFAPMLHWQNLPSVDSVYGEPDITPNLEAVQNRVNFVASNISKIIRLYAHPQRYSRMAGSMAKIEIGPDEMPNFNDQNGSINQLDAIGDLPASQNYLKMLRQAMFDMARVVDMDSLQDKIGTLTNFGLKVLYQDNLAMIGTKRELFGDMLEELVRRLQMMNVATVIPAKAVWPEMLPENETEQTASDQTLNTMGVKSKQTIADEHGLDWEQEQERIDEEDTAKQNVPNSWYTEGAQGQGQSLDQNGQPIDPNQPGNVGRPGSGAGAGRSGKPAAVKVAGK